MRNFMLFTSVILAAAQIASADTFSIDKDNLGGQLCSVASPCGTVSVTGTSTLHVAISMTSPFGVFGNNDTFGFNTVGAGDVVFSDFSSNAFSGPAKAGNEGGWGSFAYRVDGPGGSSAVSMLSFDLMRPSNPFTSAADIEAGSSGGSGSTVFGLHVRNNNSGLTGYAGVDEENMSPTPEPGSLALLGLGAAGVLALRKRLTRSQA